MCIIYVPVLFVKFFAGFSRFVKKEENHDERFEFFLGERDIDSSKISFFNLMSRDKVIFRNYRNEFFSNQLYIKL